MHPDRELVQRDGELPPPVGDLSLDLRGRSGFRHRSASVVSSVLPNSLSACSPTCPITPPLARLATLEEFTPSL
ncbi:hypothetical protein GCM10028832_09800 [Streptomyces sparsus]